MSQRKTLSDKERDTILREAGYRCAVPGCNTILAIDIHHMVEVCKGGGNNPFNLLALCPTHHALYHRGEITQESIKQWKARLVVLNQVVDVPAEIDKRVRESLARQNAVQNRGGQREGTHLSPEGTVLAQFLNKQSTTGDKFDPQVRIATLDKELALSIDDAELAIDELLAAGLLEINGSRDVVFATNRLFWETDPVFTDNDPASDAEAVARALVNQPVDTISMVDLASILNWQPRRLNPAASYLVESGKARPRPTLGAGPYCYGEIVRTPATKRFVRDHGR